MRAILEALFEVYETLVWLFIIAFVVSMFFIPEEDFYLLGFIGALSIFIVAVILAGTSFTLDFCESRRRARSS